MAVTTEADSAATPSGSPREQVMAMITGYWVSRVCGAIARLRLADHLAGGPATIAELAAATSASPDGLARLLRAAATAGLFTEHDDGRFTLTALGAELTDDQGGGSVRDYAIAMTAPGHWLPYGWLYDAVAGGEAQDRAALGMDLWAYLAATRRRRPRSPARWAASPPTRPRRCRVPGTPPDSVASSTSAAATARCSRAC